LDPAVFADVQNIPVCADDVADRSSFLEFKELVVCGVAEDAQFLGLLDDVGLFEKRQDPTDFIAPIS